MEAFGESKTFLYPFWLTMGDFNEMMFHGKKEGEGRVVRH